MAEKNRFHRFNQILSPIAKTAELLSRHEKLLPYKVIGGEEHLKYLREQMKAGKSAIPVITHFSKRDGLIAPQIAFRYFAPFSGKTVMPLASHNYKEWMGKTLGAFGIEVMPIMGAERRKFMVSLKGLSKIERRNELEKAQAQYQDYLTAAHGALLHNGMVGISSQSTRESSMGSEPKVFPIQALLDSKQNQENPIDLNNVLVLPLGIGKTGVTDYFGEEIRGFNKGEEFTINVGKSITLADAITAAEHLGHPNVDYVIHDLLMDVAPEGYVEKS